MQVILILLSYLKWHYGRALHSLSTIWGNFIYFISNYFSIKLLTQNFFTPWKRMTDNYPRSFNPKEYLFTLIVNLIMRAVGIIMRTGLIIICLICYIILIIIYPLALTVWLFLPLIIFILISCGLYLIIK